MLPIKENNFIEIMNKDKILQFKSSIHNRQKVKDIKQINEALIFVGG